MKPAVADIVARTFLKGEENGDYELAPWVVTQNHIHLVLQPRSDVPKIIARIKAWSARDANRLLSRAGSRKEERGSRCRRVSPCPRNVESFVQQTLPMLTSHATSG